MEIEELPLQSDSINLNQAIVEQCEQRYQGLFEHMKAGVAVYEAINDGDDFIFKDFNRAAEEISKVKREKVIGKRLLEMFPHMDEFGLLATLRRVYRTGKAEHLPAAYYRDEHREGWRDNYIYKLPNGEVVAIYQDVTGVKLVQNALRDSEIRWRFALEGSEFGVWDWNVITGEVFYSEKCKSILGYEDHEIGNKIGDWEDITHPDDLAKCHEIMQKHFSGERPYYEAELRVRCKDGSWKWILARGKVMEWTHERGPKRMIGNFRDVNAKKLAENALEENRQNFHAFFEAVDDIISAYKSDGSILYINPAASRKLGYSPDELKGMNALTLHNPVTRREVQQALESIIANKSGKCDFPLMTKDGIPLPVETRAWIGKWSGEDCVYCISRDVTREQEAIQKFNSVFYNNPCPMAIATFPEKKLIDVNGEFEKTTGFSREFVTGKTSAELAIFADKPVEEALTQHALAGDSIRNVEIRVRKENGDVIDGLFSGGLIKSGGQQLFIAAMVDITDIKAAEESQKKLIAELETAMSEIKTLTGLIPICASCKKIRDDQGYWQAVEVYIRDRTDAEFSHGICPDCARKLYPEFFNEK